jgi:hypothetical protein
VFYNTPKQNEAVRLFADNYTSLLEGGSRSGKTLIILKMIFIRASKYAGTKHLVTRFHFKDAKLSLWYDSIPTVIKLMGMEDVVQFNKQDLYIALTNGSEVWIGGLDDKERTEKVLGLEYATIYLGEASQISFSSYETVKTRCNPPPGVPGRIFIDYNPPSTGHWGYKMFHQRRLPDGTPLPKDDFGRLRLNPSDNPNLSPDYIEKNLRLLSAAKRRRFLLGEYASEEGALWKRKWFKYKRTMMEQCQRVVIGVDPSGSRDGDEIGIIAAGQVGHKDYRLLQDYSMHGTPNEWGNQVVRAYDDWMADCVVAEKNYGGDMVESTITDMGRRNVKVDLVTATRGKIVRAEPISAMYERGEVTHQEEMVELEEELCSYKGEAGEKSPNRLDAAVWALTELSEGALSLADVL